MSIKYFFFLLLFLPKLSFTKLKRSLFLTPAVDPLLGEHVCIHDKLNTSIGFVDSLTPEETIKEMRVIRDSVQAPIRIAVDYSNLKVSSQENQFIQKLMQISTSQFSRMLKVVRKTTNIIIPSSWTKCSEAYYPSSHKIVGVASSDLLLYVTTTYESTNNYLAYALACGIENTPGMVNRPIIGSVNFNLAYLRPIPTKNNEIEDWIQTTLHEITHVLGFSNGLYEQFQNPITFSPINPIKEEQIRSEQRKIIISQEVMKVAKAYFNCSSMTGVELENQGKSGSVGSHWKRVILMNEIMTASGIFKNNFQFTFLAIRDASYTAFTMALLKDTGWQSTDLSLAEPLFWGKGRGCDFLDQGCVKEKNNKDFCYKDDKQKEGCSFDQKQEAYCANDSYSDNCTQMRSYTNADCTNISNNLWDKAKIFGFEYSSISSCVFVNKLIESNYTWNTSSTNNTACIKKVCNENRTITFLLPNGNSGLCNTSIENKEISIQGYSGAIICPEQESFCANQTKLLCANFCSNQGYCANGICVCSIGYTGSDCSLPCQENCLLCSSIASNACISCKNNYYLDENNSCQKCNDPHCSSCNSGEPNSCTSCENYYYFEQQSRSCKPCNSRCTTCTSGAWNACTSCKERYYLDELNSCKSCYSSYSRCLECTSSKWSHCISCNSSMALYQGKCLFKCPNSYYKDEFNTCKKCVDSNCLSCTNASSNGCTICKAGYFLNSQNMCEKCMELNCLTCTSNESSSCTSCQQNYYWNSLVNECLPCFDNNCQSCTSGESNGCSKCYISNYLDQNKKCQHCFGYNCLSCTSGASNSCTSCEISSYLNESTGCQRCYSSSCEKCTSGAEGACTNCFDAQLLFSGDCVLDCPLYYFDDDNRVCQKCYSHCLTCSSNASNDCNSCDDYFYLDGNNSCQPCSAHCLVCTSEYSNSSNCIACEDSYVVDKGKCLFSDSRKKLQISMIIIFPIIIIAIIVIIVICYFKKKRQSVDTKESITQPLIVEKEGSTLAEMAKINQEKIDLKLPNKD